MIPRILRLIVPLAAFAIGCGSTSFHYLPTDSSPRPLAPHPVESVEIFFGGHPKREYVEVGLLQAQEGSLDASLRQGRLTILRKLREQAAGIGCDAILVLGQADTVEGCPSFTISAKGDRAVTKKGYRASCIVYRDVAPVGPTNDARAAEGAQ